MNPEEIPQEEIKNENIQNNGDNFSNNPEKSDKNGTNDGGISQEIEKKFPGEENQEKRKQLGDLFKSIETDFSQETILNYIKGASKISLSTLLKKGTEDQRKYLIDLIDIKEKNTDIKEKNTDIKEKNTDIKEKNTDIKEKNTDIKEKNTDIKETIDKQQKTIEIIQAARESFKSIPKEDQVSGEFGSQPQNIKDQIKQKVDNINKNIENEGDKITADEYLNMKLSADKLKGNPQYNKFIESFENLDQLGGGESINIYKDRENTEKLMSHNESLDNYSKGIDLGNNASDKEYSEKQNNIMKLNTEKDINQEFDKPEYKDGLEKYGKILPQKPENDSQKTPEQNKIQELIRKRNSMVSIIDIEQNTQNIIQKNILGSTINGLSGYFDFSTAQKENIGEEFKTTDGFNIDGDTLFLGGKIKDNNINIAYNLSNGNLASEDHMFQENDQNVLRFGEGKYQDLKINLPPIGFLKEQAKNFFDNIKVDQDNPKEFYNDLKNSLNQKLVSNFEGNKDIIKVRLERNIQKNISAQEITKDLSGIINPDGQNIFAKNFNKDENKNLFNLTKIIDDSLENYSISDIEELRNGLPKLTEFINKNTDQTDNTGNKVKTFFNNSFKRNPSENPNESQQRKTNNLLDIIKDISKKENGKRIIDIEKLNKTIGELEKGDPDPYKLPEPLSESITNPNPDQELEKNLNSMEN